MTTTGMLSDHYARLSAELGAFNDSVIEIKKRIYGLTGSDSAQDIIVSSRLRTVEEFLQRLLRALEGSTVEPYGPDAVASIVAAKLREHRIGDAEDLPEEIKESLNHLHLGLNQIKNNDVALLDSICWIMDSEASFTFRRIWKR